MTKGEAHSKITKLLALAAPGSGATPSESASARRIADRLAGKHGWPPPQSQSGIATATRALSGQVVPGWKAPPPTTQPADQGISWWQWVDRPFGSAEVGLSGVSDAQARVMAIQILSTGTFLVASDQEVIEGALNGLLTERGKILLDGLYSIIC